MIQLFFIQLTYYSLGVYLIRYLFLIAGTLFYLFNGVEIKIGQNQIGNKNVVYTILKLYNIRISNRPSHIQHENNYR